MAESAYRALSSFAVPGPGGMPRVIREGDVLSAGDPAVKSNKEAFQSMDDYVEQATAAPGEKRPTRFPSAVTQEDAVKARDTRVGPRNPKENDMPHALPPEHEDSPASPFAPGQPSAGVVADDVPPEQNPAGGPKAADAPKIVNTPPEPQTAQQKANADAAKQAAKPRRK